MSCFSDEQAKALWKARWLKRPLKTLVAEYDVDPRRFYEVWTEDENAGTRSVAFEEFKFEHPALWPTIDPSPHQPKLHVIRRPIVDEAQPSLFD